MIDLRSDTVTKPTDAMRKAMAGAEVGDDVFGEDPTVNRLQGMAAERMGKEAALFVSSGTMGNLISLLVHCGRGDEVILGDYSHTFYFEQGGSAALGGIHPRTLRNQEDGTLDLREVEAAVRPDNVHFPRTRLIVVENTHNRCYGAPLTLDYMAELGKLARRLGLKLHVDGARIFNAATALRVDARDLAAEADSITFCLSKALAAPVGSVLCGSKEFIAEARRARKVLGGGMRQSGVLAAAGIVALETMVDRLADDHANARRLAEGLTDVDGIFVDREKTVSNIVYIDITREGMTPLDLAGRLKDRGVGVLPVGPKRLRAVTNYHVSSEDIGKAVEAVKSAMAG